MNFKNLVEIFRYNFDFREVARHCRNNYHCLQFSGSKGSDTITLTQLSLIERLKYTAVIKELLCLEQPAQASRYTSSF
jgi:hypothetical protein